MKLFHLCGCSVYFLRAMTGFEMVSGSQRLEILNVPGRKKSGDLPKCQQLPNKEPSAQALGVCGSNVISSSFGNKHLCVWGLAPLLNSCRSLAKA